MEVSRYWADIFKVIKRKQLSTKNHILYPAKLFFKSEGKIKTLPKKQKLREFITTRPVLQEILKAVLQGEINSNLKPCEKIKISVKVNAWAVIKASNIVTMVYTYTFCFLHNLRD